MADTELHRHEADLIAQRMGWKVAYVSHELADFIYNEQGNVCSIYFVSRTWDALLEMAKRHERKADREYEQVRIGLHAEIECGDGDGRGPGWWYHWKARSDTEGFDETWAHVVVVADVPKPNPPEVVGTVESAA